MSKFLLLLGPSGVGKSTIIDELIRLDSRFRYISPYMTRVLRDGEKNKISISNEEMDDMRNQGKFLVINTLYGGIRYATPRAPIIEALSAELFPVLDWPVDKISLMRDAFPSQLYSVYVAPPSIKILSERLLKDGRDTDGSRLKNARDELEAFWSHRYDQVYDLAVTSEDGKISSVASAIYSNYLSSF